MKDFYDIIRKESGEDMLKLKNVSKYYAKNGVVTQGFTKVNL